MRFCYNTAKGIALMIAVTIGIGESYAKLASYAAQAMQKMTGLETVILDDRLFTASGFQYSHQLKLRIFDLVDDDSILYFDSDIVCLNPWNPKRFARADALVAVAERLHPMVIMACRDWDIPIHQGGSGKQNVSSWLILEFLLTIRMIRRL